MDYTIGQVLHGFEITRIRELDEIKATMIELKHIKTKGEMIFLKRAEKNMTFSVTMKTLPSDDTGIFHILEHSTLGGSKKYPVKEPFVELLKSTMNTFLNAMTFPDKTMYPVSSQTPKDFLNLVEVYLDAVFAPSVLTKKDIFLQEGWHYELMNEQDTPIYKGVVFNEMKGAYTSVDTYIERGLLQLLFRDNCYQYDSGGYPQSIPELTYESFIEQHDRYYSMSNAKFFLDGDAPLEEVLALIEEYAKDAEYVEIDSDIPYQKEQAGLFQKIQYPIDEDEEKEGKYMFSFGKIACKFDEPEKIYAYKILCNYLASSNDSPLKKAILKKGLAKDISLDLYDGLQQPFLVLTVRYTDEDKFEEVKTTLIEVLENELKKGLDHKIIEASLSYLEFKAKEKGNGSYPEGLANNIATLDSWIYGGDPALNLLVNNTFKSLRNKLVQGYFESLIQDFLDNKDYTASLIVEPSTTLTAELEKKETEKLAKIADTWSENYRKELVEENQHLLSWQQSVDTQEQLDTMPKLLLSDIEEGIETYAKEETTIQGVPVVKYQLNSNGITYLHLFFSVADMPQDQIPYLSLYGTLLGELPTEKYSVTELNTEIRAIFGGISTSTAGYEEIGNPNEVKPYFVVRCSYLDENQDRAFDLLNELLLHTKYDQEMIKDVLTQMETNMKQSLMMNGHSFGTRYISASHSSRGYLSEALNGYTFYQVLKQINASFDEEVIKMIETFKSFENFYTKGRLTITYVGENDIESIVDLFVDGTRINESTRYQLLPKENKEIKVPTQVSYASLGGNLLEYGDFNSGKIRVLAKIISLEYLWNEIRVKGGAYGCGLQISILGDTAFYSYRDPSAHHSIEIYKQTKQFIENYIQDKNNIDKFIISTLSDDAILSLTGKFSLAERNYFSKITDEMRLEARKQTLDAKVEDLLSLVDTLQKVIDENHTCIIGNE